MIEDGIYSYLTGISGIQNNFGNPVRLRNFQAESTLAFPRLVYQIYSDMPEHHMGGPEGLATAHVQFDIQAQSSAACSAGARALRQAVDGFQAGAWGTNWIAFAKRKNVRDIPSPPVDKSESSFYRKMMDVEIGYTEDLAVSRMRTITASGAQFDTDDVIDCDTTSGAISLALQDAGSRIPGRLLIVKQIGSANPVTLTPLGAQKIDTISNLVYNQINESHGIYSDGSNWRIAF